MAKSTEPFILIVEDDPDHAALIRAAFKKRLSHARTHTVVSGLEARSYLAGEGFYEDRDRHPLPTLVVLDLGLSDSVGFEGGFEVLGWLAEQEEVSSIPVVVFTASDHPEHAEMAYELGARRFLKKADDYGNLTKVVKEELQRMETEQREAG